MNYVNLSQLCCLLFLFSCSPSTEPSTPLRIISFGFEGVKSLSTTIDPSTQTITVEVPYQTSISALVPLIGLEAGVSIVPASGLTQNFTQAVYYTLFNGKNRKIYTVNVKVANQLPPEITQIKTDTVEAGKDLNIVGKNFGKFALDIQAFLIDKDNKESLLKHQLIDSTQIRLTTAIEQNPGSYHIKVTVKKQTVISDGSIWVGYPSPQLTAISHANLRKGDTLWLEGKYIDANQYRFLCQLQNKNIIYTLAMTKALTDKLAFIIPNNVTIGEYAVKIINTSEKKASATLARLIYIYDPSLPFVTDIVQPQAFYKKSEKITFHTIHFDAIEARFYQVNLVGVYKTYIQNGIYDDSQKTLSIELPDVIQVGNYEIHFSLSDPKKSIQYSFQTDLQIAVKE
ncbi:hypothetical protein [Emticicia sp. 17c]|uniref:hypothetical protein n=1 Tax=Emticicia sp. 17c TaxID=3127704 RepID=UPI00301D2143